MSPQSDPRYLGWLEAIEVDGVSLTTWEMEFIASLRARFDRGQDRLSETQAEILERIYAERTP